MQNIFIFSTLFFTVLAPVLLVVLGKELYNFFTKDLDEYHSWQVDDELPPIGARVLVVSMDDNGLSHWIERYVSFGSFCEYEDPKYDSHGQLDEDIYFYVDYCCDNHVIGTELCDGEVITQVIEWSY